MKNRSGSKVFYTIAGLLCLVICAPQVISAQQPQPDKTEPQATGAPSMGWKGLTAKQDLDLVTASAKTFNSQAHLFMVKCNSDGYSDDKEGYRKVDGRIKPEAWDYWFRDPGKEEKDIFFVRYDDSSGSYIANDHVILLGDVRRQDQGDIVPDWKIDSDAAFRIAWDKAASVRSQHFKLMYADYKLTYDYIRNTRDLVFAWKITFHYEQVKNPEGKYSSPKNLIVYIAPETGEVLSYGPRNLSEE